MVLLPPHAELVDWLGERLRGPLPGLEAQLSMAPPLRGSDEEELRQKAATCRHAAVIVLLYPGGSGESLFVLTLRQRALQAHSGQVCLPGGSIHDGEQAVEAALREAHEEVGVAVASADVLGELTELYIPPSHFCVRPVVAAMGARPSFERQQEEVAAIVEAPLGALIDPERRASAVWRLRGHDVRVPYYQIGGHEVWGATAMMLSELAEIIEERQIPDA